MPETKEVLASQGAENFLYSRLPALKPGKTHAS